ncbi:MAG: triacylglycerol lipase [Hahellaceae bacterium]|nr:triacylglycerol lipase [Hahellaceae bacterium]MCP5212713.1 triacylglycerol lipase [Hahellaceae bacterium]
MKKTTKLARILACAALTSMMSAGAYAVGCSQYWLTSGGYTDTKYPFLLVHGVTGFDSVGGLIGYFHTVPMNLCRSGADVKVAQVSPLNDSEQRGERLARDINNNVYGNSAKFNIMAHSQGSPTTRAAITFDANMNAWGKGRIASLTSVDGVNKGSKTADMIRGIIPVASGIEGGVAGLANAFGTVIGWISGDSSQQNAVEALNTLTTPGTLDLNTRHPYGVASGYCTNDRATSVSVRGNTVKLYSWAGKKVFTNVLDVLDGFLVTTSLAFKGETNDGLVSECSQKLGHFIGSYNANHIDAINHVLGVRYLWHDPITPYRTQANRLKNAGL